MQVWDCLVCNDDERLITGAADSELRVWDITYKDQGEQDGEDGETLAKKAKLAEVKEFGVGVDNEDEEEEEESVGAIWLIRSNLDHLSHEYVPRRSYLYLYVT